MSSKAEQDYLLAIYHISKNKGAARTTDIATVLNIKSPSVTDMLSKLSKKNLILYKKYEGARLAPKGDEIAKSLLSRQIIFKKFLKRLFIPENLIEKDAQVFEHGLSRTTMRQFAKFVQFMDLFGDNPCFFAHFKNYCEKGEISKEVRTSGLICSTNPNGSKNSCAPSAPKPNSN